MENAHLPLMPICGACGDAVLSNEWVVALSGNDDSTACAKLTKPFRFPEHGVLMRPVSEWQLCHRSICDECANAPEATAVHFECFQIFKARYQHPDHGLTGEQVLQRLWTASLWRSPWRKAPLIQLSDDAVNRRGLAIVAEIAGIANLTKLPIELISAIRYSSAHSLLWRSSSVVALSLEEIDPPPFLRIPLDRLASWKRGEPLLQAPPPLSLPPYVIITIDVHGISSIERLPERPRYDHDTRTDLAFVIEDIKRLANTHVEFKDGLVRLCLPEAAPRLQIWNTRGPPSSAACKFINPLTAEYVQLQSIPSPLYTVDFDRCRGLTFFFSFGTLYNIHIHRPGHTSAAGTYERFSRRRQQKVVWIYLPIALKDRVLALGTRRMRNGTNVLVRTHLAGEIILGPLGERSEPDRLLGHGSHLTLIYGAPQAYQPLCALGAFSPSAAGQVDPAPEFLTVGRELDATIGYLSWAPLSNIESIRIFHDDDSGLCKGIIFEYENGGLRALGQCRLGVDRSTLSVRPSRLCFKSRLYSMPTRMRKCHSIRIELGSDSDHMHRYPLWECVSVNGGGVLYFSSTPDSSYMSYHDQWPPAERSSESE